MNIYLLTIVGLGNAFGITVSPIYNVTDILTVCPK
jgi:hypothetical protein